MIGCLGSSGYRSVWMSIWGGMSLGRLTVANNLPYADVNDSIPSSRDFFVRVFFSKSRKVVSLLVVLCFAVQKNR